MRAVISCLAFHANLYPRRQVIHALANSSDLTRKSRIKLAARNRTRVKFNHGLTKYVGFDAGSAAIVDNTASRAQPGHDGAVFADDDICAVHKMSLPQSGILHWMGPDDKFDVGKS